MKRVLSLSLLLLAAACGTAQDQATVQSVMPDDVKQPARMLVDLDGTIDAVVAKAADAPASGLWTEVTIGFVVPCTIDLETISLSYEQGLNGKTHILASAYASAVKDVNHAGPVCQAFSYETRTLTLPGIVALEDLELINVTQKRTDIPQGTIGVFALENIKVAAVRSLCPADVVCKMDGTVVTLEIALNSCVNSLGPVAFHAHQDLSATGANLTLAVNAIEFQNERAPYVRCAQTIETVDVTLPNMYAGVDAIDLIVLK